MGVPGLVKRDGVSPELVEWPGLTLREGLEIGGQGCGWKNAGVRVRTA
ncbi:hypothetical protein CGMCC3_g8910 [Colletotrichum fructicola]|nr:uncharacterized protein CGMCC3_g8910 [Colletotrichum fructicola]KAE9574906.1 hypothetical protein CGMCC3_g8910 [Colletotrichum fructicola]